MGIRHKVSWVAVNGSGHGSFEIDYPITVTDGNQINQQQLRDLINGQAGFDMGPIQVLDVHPTGSAR